MYIIYFRNCNKHIVNKYTICMKYNLLSFRLSYIAVTNGMSNIYRVFSIIMYTICKPNY